MKKLLFLLLIPSAAIASPLSDWQSHMTQYAWPVCTYLKDPNQSFDGHLNNIYYDGERVFFQICDYTHDPLYCECARAAEQIYRDQYLIPNNGSLPGYWLFADGLAEDFTRNGDSQSNIAYHMLMSNGSFVQSSPWNDANQPDWSYIRETAYALRLHIMAPKFGMSRNNARITQLVNFQLGQLDQFFGSKTAPYRKPFMTGLASEALIDYYEHIQQDGTILVALRQAADYMWNNMWLASEGAFQYTDDPRPISVPGNSCSQGEEPCGQGREPAPDLNQLIAPLYEWLYQRTGLQKYRDQGDAIFAGGVVGAYLLNGKQFNQSYRWSFKYVELRYGGGNPTPSPTPQATNTTTPISTSTPTPRPTATRTPIPTIQPTSTPFSCPTAKPCPTCPVVTPCPAVTPCAACPPICPKAIAASFDGGANWKTLNFWKRTSKCRYK